MMRVLFCDVVSSDEHRNYNYGVLRALEKIGELDICAKEGYVTRDDFCFDKYYSIPNTYIFQRDKVKYSISIEYRLCTFHVYQWIKKNIDLKSYDAVWFSSLEELTFYLCFNNCPTQVFVTNHLISDLENSKVKRWAFKHINDKYHIVALEDYIKEYLERELCFKNRIHVVRHPLPNIESDDSYIQENLFFAPAISNDESFVDYLIENENRIPDGYRIVIRSKIREYRSNKLEIYNNKISNKDYLRLLNSCKATLIHYGNDYNYRTSGVWFESLKYKKPSIMYCNSTMDYYAKEYPNIIFPFYINDEFWKCLEEMISKNCNAEDFIQGLEDYSDHVLLRQVSKALDINL